MAPSCLRVLRPALWSRTLPDPTSSPARRPSRPISLATDQGGRTTFRSDRRDMTRSWRQRRGPPDTRVPGQRPMASRSRKVRAVPRNANEPAVQPHERGQPCLGRSSAAFRLAQPPCLWACAIRSAFSQARRDFPGPVLARASRAQRLRPRLGREEGRRPAEPAPGAAGRARGEKEGSRRSVHRFCFPRSRASLPLLGSRIGLSACQRTDALGGRSMGGRGCRAGRPSGAIVSPRVECARLAVCLTPPIQSRSGRPARATARGRPKAVPWVRQRS